MSRKLKVRGALRAYLLWPVILTVVLLCMNLIMYPIDRLAGYAMTAFTVLYFVMAMTIYMAKRSKIATELVRYAMDYGQVQKRLLKN
jgi:hypothetical protein